MSHGRVGTGHPYPLGATPDSTGTNFALFSDNADGVTLCLFSDDGSQEVERIDIHECTNGIWHCHLRGIGRGQVYGYRVHGPWAPEEGHRFNSNKLLLDPYARQLVGEIKWDDAVYGYRSAPRARPTSSWTTATARPSCRRPGSARRCPSSPPPPEGALAEIGDLRGPCQGPDHAPPDDPRGHRGTFAALARPEIIDHLSSSASPRSSSCRSTPSPRTTTCSRRGCATTGATTRSPSSRPSPAISAITGSRRSRWPSTGSTRPGSR
jgi:isoamylase